MKVSAIHRATFFTYGAGSTMQADNRSAEIKALGIPQPGIAYTYQINPSFGGPDQV